MKRFLLFVLVVAIFLAGLYAWTHRRAKQPQGTPFTPASAPVLDTQNVHVLSSIDEENTRVVDAVLPSVVSITTSKQVQTGYILDPYEFFQNHRLLPRIQNLSVLGSGVIVSKEGHILTNNHVVADMDKIQVQLNDGRVVPADIIGGDPDTDIAVLKINADNLTPLLLGNSDDVKVGQVVFAVGNPLGLQETVTHGIISAKSRVVDLSSLEYFQTDAAINEGNSGGPLVDLRGEVIGINTRVASSQEPNHLQPQGLSFAIPSNVAKRSMEAIIKFGKVERGYFEVKVNTLPPQLASQLGVNQANGVLVIGVTPGTPADTAGLKAGDVIVKFNNHEIAGPRDLQNRVAETPANTDISLGVIRADGKAESLMAHIIAQPAQLEAQPAPNILSGIEVAEIPADRRAQIPATVKGVIVTGFAPDSPLGTILQTGDVIEEIDHVPVASVADFEQIGKQIPPGPQQAVFLVYRGGRHTYIPVAPR